MTHPLDLRGMIVRGLIQASWVSVCSDVSLIEVKSHDESVAVSPKEESVSGIRLFYISYT
jgi:hypothetical protein